MISAKELLNMTKGLDLLIVEDDEQLRTQMAAMCRDLFKDVDVAENGQIGLQKYQEKSHPFDLVITDINMPVMNGIDMIKHIYETHPYQSILVISAHNESDYLVQLLDIGIDSFLIKPMKHDKIMLTLYKITQNIVNKQLLEEHYRKIETLNAELSEQKKELQQSNESLKEKNIALEKSMRIIEGMQHKDRLQRNINAFYTSTETPTEKKGDSTTKHILTRSEETLKEIEDIISDIILESHYKGLKNELLQLLCTKIEAYTVNLPDKTEYAILKKSLGELADTVKQRPACTNMKELERIFNMLESFFFVYGRWQKELDKIGEQDFNTFSHSISNEIHTLIKVWQCKV